MTTVKRLLCLGLCAACLLLCGCETEPYPFEEMLTGSEAEIPSYALVIPSEETAEYRVAAEALAEGIRRTVGNQTKIYLDRDELPGEGTWITVALGPVSLPWVSPELRAVKSLDYCCRWLEEGLWLGGRTPVAVSAAVDRFIAELLPSARAELLLSREGGFEAKGVYEAEELLLQGVALSEYRIVCEGEGLLPMAVILRDRIRVVSGDLLTVETGNGSSVSERAILLRQSSPYGTSHTAYVYPEGPSVVLCANDSFGVSVALREFCEILLTKEEGARWEKTVEAAHSVYYGSPTLTLGSFSVDALQGFDSPGEVTKAVEQLRPTLPDLVLPGSVPEQQIHYFTDSLSQYGTPLNQTDAPSVLVGQRAPTVERDSAISLRLCGEDSGFLLLWMPRDATEAWCREVQQIVSEAELPLLILLHGDRDTVAAREEELSRLPLLSVLQRDYQGRDGESRLICLATEGTLSVEMTELSVENGYAGLTVRRLSLS